VGGGAAAAPRGQLAREAGVAVSGFYTQEERIAGSVLAAGPLPGRHGLHHEPSSPAAMLTHRPSTATLK